jgi:type IV pilus assembly protein PilX
MKNIQRQRGAALLVALMILLIVSIIGVAAMRSSTLASRVAMGAQLDAIVFEAAESAIAETMANLTVFNASDDELKFEEIVSLFNGETITWCLQKDLSRKLDSCGNSDFLDSRSLITAESRSKAVGFSAVSGNQISSAGGAAVLFADFELAIQGDGAMPGYGLSNRHVQQALRRGMIPAKEIQ